MNKQEILVLRHVTHAFVRLVSRICYRVSHPVSFGIRVSNGWDSVVVVAAPCTAIQDNMQIHIWHMQDATICLHGWGKTSYNIWLGSCNLAEADQVLSLGNPPPMPHPSPPCFPIKIYRGEVSLPNRVAFVKPGFSIQVWLFPKHDWSWPKTCEFRPKKPWLSLATWRRWVTKCRSNTKVATDGSVLIGMYLTFT